jgi:2-haloacid dehalogenase
MRWVTFDCFGTLIDWNTGFASILRPLAGDSTSALMAAYHRCERAVEGEKPHRLYKHVLVESVLRAAEDIGMAVSEGQAQALPDSWDRLPLFADVEPMLASLRGSGYSIGVLTNCDDDLFERTERAFVVRFDRVITAEQVRSYKPSLAHFHRFASLAKPDHWVHVACSWYHDISPARELGIKRIWLDRDRTGEDPAAASARVTSAGEVSSAVARLA